MMTVQPNPTLKTQKSGFQSTNLAKYYPGHEKRAFCERSQQPENVHTDFYERSWMFKN
jgi:hypothetical protein